MYQKILVPLDGSKLAECVLTQLRKLVDGGVVGEIMILTVVGFQSNWWVVDSFDYASLEKRMIDLAQKYLADLQSQLNTDGIKVKTEVIKGEPAPSIIEYATKNGIDLIVIATHGYTGVKRAMFGSVALRVMHDSHIPVLMVRPELCQE